MSGPRTRRFALVAGGGTAGHLVPAVAVAEVLVDRRGPGSVELVGSRRGHEATRTAPVGLPSTLLPGRGIVRRFDPAGLLANARAVAGLSAAVIGAAALIARRRPAVVVAVGGYASVPAALAAACVGVPVVVVNVDAVPGLANRVVARLARASAVAGAGTPLPRAVVTGAPVRAEVAALAGAGSEGPSAEARRALGVPGGRILVVAVGGSLGARRINQAVLDLARHWQGRRNVAIYHIVGRRDVSWAAGEHPGAGGTARLGDGEAGLWYRQVAFEDRMPVVYRAADVVIGRAGAMTVAELATVGVPSVLVPLPGAPGDHQTANASVLAAVGGAVLLPDAQCDGVALAEVLDPIVADPGRRRAMAAAAAALGRPAAAEAVATVVEAHARPGGQRGTWRSHDPWRSGGTS